MTETVLAWDGPYEFTSANGRSLFAAPAAMEASGLYLWTVETAAGYLVHYVGETRTTFARRHYEHFCEYTAGAYTIHRAESFAQGRRDPVYRGFAYPKDRWRRAQAFIDDFAAHGRALTEMLATLRIFVAPLEADQRVRRRIEGALIQAMYQNADVEVAAFQEDGMRAWRRRPDEAPIDVVNLLPVVIRGMPQRLEA